jgi:hypothetical protein
MIRTLFFNVALHAVTREDGQLRNYPTEFAFLILTMFEKPGTHDLLHAIITDNDINLL